MSRRFKKRKVRELQNQGVIFIDPNSAYVAEDVVVGPGTVIYPNVYLYKGTQIGKDCEIYPETHIFHSVVGDKCTIWPSVSLLGSTIGYNVTINRNNRIVYSSISNGARIESGCTIKHSEIHNDCFVADVDIIEHSDIAHNAEITSGSKVTNSFIGPYSKVERSIVDNSKIYSRCTIGPNAYIRHGSRVFEHAEIARTEVVRSFIGQNTKAKHGIYIGDASIGRNCNIGAGTVFCNYDGSEKHKAVIEDDVFIGSGTMIIAPVTLRRESFVAAGSVVSKDVPPNALVIARGQYHTHYSLDKTPANIDEGAAVKEEYVTKDESGWHIKKPR